jgi:hypothetical protein
MFNLEQSIAEWRRQMLDAGIKAPALLDELESHVREDVEQQMKAGLNPQKAFDAAVRRIGHARALKLEFKKAGASIETRFARLVGISCGVIAGLFSLWILLNLFTIHEVNSGARMSGFVAVTFIILSWRYGGRLLPAIPRESVRTVLGVLCCLASLGGMKLFIESILPNLLEVPAGADLHVGHLLVSLVWAWTAISIFGAIAYRLGDVPRKDRRQHV